MRKNQKKANQICDFLFEFYKEAHCSLDFDNDPFKLLIMSRLSAQCTDKRVNIVSKELFEKFPDAESFANASYEEIEKVIKPCGLFRTKAKSIKDMSQMLISDFGGQVPKEMDQLLKLPGVGRKIANLMRGDCFNLGGIVADTHCIRLSNRFGLCDSTNPVIVERTLNQLIEHDKQSGFCHRLVYFGREFCKAQSPFCEKCPLRQKVPFGCKYVKLK